MSDQSPHADEPVAPKPTAVDVTFDGPPSAEGPRFVEVHNAGTSNGVRFGEWVPVPEVHPGWWALRITLDGLPPTPTAEDLIAAERRRQITDEGYTPEHDRTHNSASALLRAARAYADGVDVMWPWDPEFYKPKNRLRDLIRAGALAVAAMERLRDDRPYVDDSTADLAARIHEHVCDEIDGILGEARTILGGAR